MKRRQMLAALFLALAPAIQARIPVTGSHPLTRGWEFIRGDMASPWQVFRPVKAGSPEAVPLWTAVALPHCANALDAADPDANYYQGPCWYRTLLDIPNPYHGGHTLLEFEGAGQKTQVYVYTTLVATHTGGYDEWTADITAAADSFTRSPDAQRFGGKIPVAVRCDNSRDVQMIPSNMSDFCLYGGLYRPVNIICEPPTALRRVTLTPHVKQHTISTSIYIERPRRDARLCLNVTSPTGKVVCSMSGISVEAENNIHLDIHVPRPQLWDVDHPQLYTVTAILQTGGSTQTYTAKTGFRTFEFRPHGPFMLNGRRLLLRGTHRHEDHASVGAAMTDSMTTREMIMIRDMGANFIRLAHYQQSDRVLQLCDSLGLLVWEEIPWCRGGLGGDTYKRQARRMLANMIMQHANHPAIILWGLGNENDCRATSPSSAATASVHSWHPSTALPTT